MTKNEQLKEELSQHFNKAHPHRQKLVLASEEYQLAMKAGDVESGFKIAYGIIYGSGKTRAESNRNAKQIKRDDFNWDHI